MAQKGNSWKGWVVATITKRHLHTYLVLFIQQIETGCFIMWIACVSEHTKYIGGPYFFLCFDYSENPWCKFSAIDLELRTNCFLCNSISQQYLSRDVIICMYLFFTTTKYMVKGAFT